MVELQIVVMVNATEVTGVPQVQPEEVDPFLEISIVQMFLRYQQEQQQLASSTERDATLVSSSW